MTDPPPDDQRCTLSDDFAAVLQREAPWFHDRFLRGRRTGWNIAVNNPAKDDCARTEALLRAYFAGLASDPTRHVEFLSDDPAKSWIPVDRQQLGFVMALSPIGGMPVLALAVLLRDIFDNVLDLGGRSAPSG